MRPLQSATLVSFTNQHKGSIGFTVSEIKFLSGAYPDEIICFAVMYKTGVYYDPEAIGETIYKDTEFGMIYPPCRIAGFAHITDEMIEQVYGSFSFKDIKDKLEVDQFFFDLESKLSYLFVYDDENDVFQEVGHQDFKTLFNTKKNTYSIDLKEYEIGFEG